MNWGELKSRIMEAIGAVTGELDGEIEGWAQDAIDDLHSENRWPWDRKSTSIKAHSYLTGTCSYQVDLFAITLNTGGLAASANETQYDGGLIQLEGGNIYEITDYNQSTQSVTVASAITDATKAGATGSYQMIQDTVTLPADVESIVEIYDALDGHTLRPIAHHERRRMFPNPFDGIGNYPTHYWTRGVDSTGAIEVGIYPAPSEDRTYTLEYWARAAYPTNDADELEAVTGVPRRFHPVILARGKAKAYEFEDENESKRAFCEAEYQRGVQRMREFCRPDAHAHRQFKSDRGPGYRWWDPDAHTDIDASNWSGGLGF